MKGRGNVMIDLKSGTVFRLVLERCSGVGSAFRAALFHTQPLRFHPIIPPHSQRGHVEPQRHNLQYKRMSDTKRKLPAAAAAAAAGASKRVRRADESEREDLDAQSRDVDVWLVKVPPYLMEEWEKRRRLACSHSLRARPSTARNP
jgi:hypothetical protein